MSDAMPGRPSPSTVAGWKSHANCDHTRYDRLILHGGARDVAQAEAWDRLAAAAYRREHPEPR